VHRKLHHADAKLSTNHSAVNGYAVGWRPLARYPPHDEREQRGPDNGQILFHAEDLASWCGMHRSRSDPATSTDVQFDHLNTEQRFQAAKAGLQPETWREKIADAFTNLKKISRFPRVS
jgi:hypothetical protein